MVWEWPPFLLYVESTRPLGESADLISGILDLPKVLNSVGSEPPIPHLAGGPHTNLITFSQGRQITAPHQWLSGDFQFYLRRDSGSPLRKDWTEEALHCILRQYAGFLVNAYSRVRIVRTAR